MISIHVWWYPFLILDFRWTYTRLTSIFSRTKPRRNYMYFKLQTFCIILKGKLFNNSLPFTNLPIVKMSRTGSTFKSSSKVNLLLHYSSIPFSLGFVCLFLNTFRNCRMRSIATAPSYRSSTRRVPASSSSAPAREPLRSDSSSTMITNASMSLLQEPRHWVQASVLLKMVLRRWDHVKGHCLRNWNSFSVFKFQIKILKFSFNFISVFKFTLKLLNF